MLATLTDTEDNLVDAITRNPDHLADSAFRAKLPPHVLEHAIARIAAIRDRA